MPDDTHQVPMPKGETESPVIQLQNVYRTYEMGDQVLNALDGVSLDISRNEYVAIVGASGSGKSTMMNIIGCLDRITKGDYLLNGTNVGDMSEAELAIQVTLRCHPDQNCFLALRPFGKSARHGDRLHHATAVER